MSDAGYDDEQAQDEAADLHDGCRRVLEATESALSTTEAALAESRGDNEENLRSMTAALKVANENTMTLAATTEAALAEAKERKDEWHKRFDILAEEMAALRNDYAALVEHHRQCELAGTELCEAAKRWLSETGPGLKVNTMVGRQRTSTAVKTWDAHQWPEAEVDRA